MEEADEVALGSDPDDDYEVVPVGPIRKLERRMDEIEQTAKNSDSDPEMIRDVLDIMKSNQKIVNDMTESTHQLKNEVEDLTHKMDEVVDNMNSFMNLLKEASETDLEGEVMNDMHNRIAKAIGNEMQNVSQDIQDSNDNVAEAMERINQSIQQLYMAEQNRGVSGVERGSSESPSQRAVQQSESRNQNPSGNPSGSERRGQAEGMNIDRSQSGDRMQKLREKFEESE